MVNPVEYMTAVIISSVVFIAISGIILGMVAARDNTPMGRLIVIFNVISIILGVLCMYYVLRWFVKPVYNLNVYATYSLVFQFGFAYVPLSVVAGFVVFRRRKIR